MSTDPNNPIGEQLDDATEDQLAHADEVVEGYEDETADSADAADAEGLAEGDASGA